MFDQSKPILESLNWIKILVILIDRPAMNNMMVSVGENQFVLCYISRLWFNSSTDGIALYFFAVKLST